MSARQHALVPADHLVLRSFQALGAAPGTAVSGFFGYMIGEGGAAMPRACTLCRAPRVGLLAPDRCSCHPEPQPKVLNSQLLAYKPPLQVPPAVPTTAGVSNELALRHVPEVDPRWDDVAGPPGRRGDQVLLDGGVPAASTAGCCMPRTCHCCNLACACRLGPVCSCVCVSVVVGDLVGRLGGWAGPATGRHRPAPHPAQPTPLPSGLMHPQSSRNHSGVPEEPRRRPRRRSRPKSGPLPSHHTVFTASLPPCRLCRCRAQPAADLQVGGFTMMHREDLRRVAPWWVKFSEDVRADRLASGRATRAWPVCKEGSSWVVALP